LFFAPRAEFDGIIPAVMTMLWPPLLLALRRHEERRAVLTGSIGHCAVVWTAALLTSGRAAVAAPWYGQRRSAAIWVAAPGPTGPLAAPPRGNPPPRLSGTIIHHGPRSVATPIVLIEQSRRVNLSRLGGLQGP